MMQKIGGLYTRVMARIIAAREMNRKEDHPKTIVHRHVEVTVERESVSFRMPSQPANDAGGTVDDAPAEAPRPPRSLRP